LRNIRVAILLFLDPILMAPSVVPVTDYVAVFNSSTSTSD